MATENVAKNISVENSKERSILDRLITIRVGKTKILTTLALIKQKEENGEEIDRGLFEKLVSSYDSLKSQEDEYINLLKKLAAFQDVNITNEKTDILENSETVKDDEESDLKIFAEAEKMAQKAITASNIQDQLQWRIKLSEEKKKILAQLHEKNTLKKNEEANKALQDAEFAKLQLASEKKQISRKQEQLDRLRRKALQRGYVLNKSEQKSPAISQEENKLTEAYLKNLNDEIVLNLNEESELESEERVPVVSGIAISDSILESNSRKIDPKYNSSDDFHGRISKRFLAFENRKQRMKQLRSKLREFEGQKMEQTYNQAVDRLKNLTEMRVQLEQMQLAETSNLENGQESNLASSLDGISAQLNEMTLPTEGTKEEISKSSSVSDLESSPDTVSLSTDEINCLVDIVEQLQNRLPSPIYHQPKCSNNSAVTVVPVPSFGNFGSNSSTINLLAATQPSPTISPSPFLYSSIFSVMKTALCRADSGFLVDFGSALLRIAESAELGSEEPALDNLLQRLESNLENSTSNKTQKIDKNAPLVEKSGVNEALLNLNTSHKATIEKNSTPPIIEEKNLDKNFEQVSSDLNFNHANHNSISVRGFFDEQQKHQTLAYICNLFVAPKEPKVSLTSISEKNASPVSTSSILTKVPSENSIEEASEKEPGQVNGVEKEICVVIESVIKWINEQQASTGHEEGIALTENDTENLKNLIIKESIKAFLPHYALTETEFNTDSALFVRQLDTLVEQNLAQYVGQSLTTSETKQTLIMELSELLYNEFAFFKLMSSADTIAQKDF